MDKIHCSTFRYGILVALALFLSACSTLTELRLDLADKVFGREPIDTPVELKEIIPTRKLALNWSKQLGETKRYDLSAAVEAGYVYAANAEGELFKFDLESGQQQWKVNTEETISGGVGTGGALILTGTSTGKVLAHNVKGELVWQSQISSEVLSAPKYYDGMVVARSGDNKIYGLDAVDGKRKWVYERKVPPLSLRSSAGVEIDGGAVYAGFSGGKMVAIRADNGKLLWDATVAIPKGVTEIERIADVTSNPIVVGPVVYAVAFQGRVAAVDRVNGKVLWNRDVSSYAGMSYDSEKIYITHSIGSVYSLDYATGKTFWRQPDFLHRRLTKPLPMQDTVVLGDVEGYLHFLDMESGKEVSRIRLGSEPIMAIVQGNSASQVIVTTRAGGLYAVTIGEVITVQGSPVSKPQTESYQQLDDEFDFGNQTTKTKDKTKLEPSASQPDDEFSGGSGINE